MLKIIHNVSLDQLIEGCIQQDRLCQKKVYEMYYGKMIAVCMRYTNNQETAREILNMGFVKVFRMIDQFKKNGGNFDGWVYRIMVNTSIDYIRAEMKHQHQDIDKSIFVDRSESALDMMSAEELIALIQDLSPAYRAVFNLYVMEGHSHPEIAEILNISEGTSKSNLAKARVKLQDMIKKKFNITRANYAQ